MQMLMLTVSLNVPVDTLTHRVGFCLSAAASVSVLRLNLAPHQLSSRRPHS